MLTPDDRRQLEDQDFERALENEHPTDQARMIRDRQREQLLADLDTSLTIAAQALHEALDAHQEAVDALTVAKRAKKTELPDVSGLDFLEKLSRRIEHQEALKERVGEARHSLATARPQLEQARLAWGLEQTRVRLLEVAA